MEDSTAFKNLINSQVVKTIADEIVKVNSDFNKNEFIKISDQLAQHELKSRVLLIAAALKQYLPASYPKSLKVIMKVMDSDKLEGFALWPFSEFIGQFGLDHFDESMNAMYLLTQKFTSEFAIRPYFLKDHQLVLKYFKKWSSDKNHHVRRWVSEGSRPLLPWGLRLPVFVNDPSHTLLLLNQLKFDEELYVRKSVANHLNDISKHHPKVVIDALVDWEKKCPPKHLDKINWIKRHALRTLIKKGDARALKLMGVKGDAKVKLGNLKLQKNKIKLGDKLEFQFEMISASKAKQKIVIDYLIYFLKSNGSLSPKVFKLKTIELKSNEKLIIKKSHSLKKITTMKFYPGEHKLAIQLNGKVIFDKKWILET